MAIPETIKKLANDIRTKIYGREVRESLAKGIEEAGNIADETQTRQDVLERQFQTVLDETTGKDVISAPEILAARVSAEGTNHNNLKERLDKEYNKVTSQLAQNEQDIRNIYNKIENIKFRDLEEPFYICHRGGLNIFPENTLEAFAGCLALGNPFIEMDVRTLADGSLGVIHDSTVDRTTDKNGKVTDFSAMGFRNLNVDVLYGYKNVNAPLFEDVVTTFGKSAIYCPESKDEKSVQKIVDIFNRYDLKEYALIQSGSLSDLLPAIEQGYATLLLTSSENPATIKANGIEYVGVPKNVSDSYIQSCISNGLKVIVYTVNRRYERDQLLNKGVSGFFTDDPFYLSETINVLKKDPFINQMFYHGMQPSASYRGGFISPNKFGFLTTNDEIRDFILQGWAGKLPSNFTIEFELTYDQHVSGGWLSVGVCTPIDFFDDNISSISSGYHIIIGHNGVNYIHRVDNGKPTLLISGSTTAPVDGQATRYRLTVTNEKITLENLQTGHVLNATDNTYRGGYFHLGRKSSGGYFSNISII
jgi:glycerophosphoryl diester phosphodiesterase